MTDRTTSRGHVVPILVASTCITLTGVWTVPFVLARGEKPIQPASQPADILDELAEPPLELVLHVDGQTHNAQLDRPFRICVGDRDLNVKVTARPYRTFRAAGLEFQYPRHFAFEADRSNPAITIWTLDGNDAVIMVMKPTAQMQPDQLCDSAFDATRAELGAENTRETESSTRRLGGQPVSGKRLITSVGSVIIHQDFLVLRRGKSAVLLIIQDAPEDGKGSEENRRVRELLDVSFRLTP